MSATWLLTGTLPFAFGKYQCLNTDSELIEELHVGVPGNQTHFKAFTVPPILPDLDSFKYAYQHAFVVLPRQCVQSLGLKANVGDSNGVANQWMGRLSDLDDENVGHVDISTCACGWVIFLHGSGGFVYDNARYAINMAAAGYGVIAPDSFASKKFHLRYRAPVKHLAKKLRRLSKDLGTSTYWCDNVVYKTGCTPSMINQSSELGYPLCYSSSAEAILSHTQAWRMYYERIFQLRRLELDALVENMPHFIKVAEKLFLAGESEGGMVASRYHNARLEPLLARGGRIILQWSCEWCYFVSCPSNAHVGPSDANISTPILNMVASTDPFFGAVEDSIAWQVAHGLDGYGTRNATGNCYRQLKANGFHHVYVLDVKSSKYHGLTQMSGNLVRFALFSFLAAPRSPTFLSAADATVEQKHTCKVVVRDSNGMYAHCYELGREAYVLGKAVARCASPSSLYHTQYHCAEDQCPVLFGKADECTLPSLARLSSVNRSTLHSPISWLSSLMLCAGGVVFIWRRVSGRRKIVRHDRLSESLLA